MRPSAQLDPYEVLEVPRSASPEEVERAYQLALETWADDSLAGYPLVSPAEGAAVCERVEMAYRVLSDPRSRQAYDASNGAAARPDPEAIGPDPDPDPEPFDDLEEEGADWTGPRLRRARLRSGLELDEVARVTKINPTFLRFIEEERYADLPARVYLRGFVSAYATCVGLQGSRVASGYLERWEQSRSRPRRGRS